MDGLDHDLLIKLHEKVDYLTRDVQKLSDDTLKRIEVLEVGRAANVKRIESLENWQFWIKGGLAIIITIGVPMMSYLVYQLLQIIQSCSVICQ